MRNNIFGQEIDLFFRNNGFVEQIVYIVPQAFVRWDTPCRCVRLREKTVFF
jgi:hypothetical protein